VCSSDVCNRFQNKSEISATAFLARRGFARSLICRSFKLIVAEPAATAFEKNDALVVFEKLGDEQTAFGFKNLRSRRNGQNHVRAVCTVFIASGAGLPVFRVPMRLKSVAAKVAFIFVANENDVAAGSAVSAVGTAFRQIFFATEAEATVSAVSGAQVNFGFVDKHFFLTIKF